MTPRIQECHILAGHIVSGYCERVQVEQATKSVGKDNKSCDLLRRQKRYLLEWRLPYFGRRRPDAGRVSEGEIGRISPEAPVPVMHLQRSESRLGGASNRRRNVAALGAHVSVFGVVGADGAGEALCRHLDELRIDREGIAVCGERPTTRKTRLMSIEHNQQVFRFDEEVTDEISAEQENTCCN